MKRAFVLFCLFLVSASYAQLNNLVFDYVVVGSGAGGIAVARELSSNPSVRVLLIEQGEVCTACTSLGAATQDNDQHQHRLYPLQQQFAALLRQPTDIEFEAFGGKTKLMGNVYTRPTSTFLNTEFPAELNAAALLPFYKEMEDHFCYYLPESMTNISAANCSYYHGKGGPIQVTPQVWPVLTETTMALANYARANNFFDTDYTDYTHNGLAFEQNFKKSSDMSNIFAPRSRGDPQIQLLPPSVLAARPNLVLLLNSRVQQILIDSFTKRAYGVLYTTNNSAPLIALAATRVWLCAGALRTPQILQISGVGPAALLQSIGVPVIANNSAVGATLKAEMATIMGFQTKKTINHNSTYGSYNVMDWWFNTGLSPYPDVQVEILEGIYDASVEPDGSLPFPVIFGLLGGATSLNFMAMELEMLTPAAVGHVSARTPTIDQTPEWDLGWTYADFGTSQDLSKLLIAIATIRNLMTGNNSFANNYILQEVWPGQYFIQQLATVGITTDAAAMAAYGLSLQQLADYFFLQYYITHFFHITTTVPLGTATNLNGAVNGVTGLSVCDNGVLPAKPDGNPTATTLAVCTLLARNQAAIDK